MDSLGLAWTPWTHLDSLGLAWTRLDALGLALTSTTIMFFSSLAVTKKRACFALVQLELRLALGLLFPQPPWQLSSKVSTVWPCSVHAVGENVLTFNYRITFE